MAGSLAGMMVALLVGRKVDHSAGGLVGKMADELVVRMVEL
jgi:hypothetical protein